MDGVSLQETLVTFYREWHNLAYTLITLGITLVVTLIAHLLLRKRYRAPANIKHVWFDSVVSALNAPLQVLLWVTALTIIEQALTVGRHLPILTRTTPPIRDILGIIILGWFTLRLTRRAVKNLHARAISDGKTFDKMAADIVGKCITALVFIIGVLVVMQLMGLSIASLLTFGGVAGIALGFAAQGLVSNLLGGITIYASKPFKVGDHVILPDSGLSSPGGYLGWQAGEVIFIGWRATCILDWNGKLFYVPNSKFNSNTVINHSRMLYREMSQAIYLRLQDIDKVEAIVAEGNRMLEDHPDMGDYLVFKFDSYGEFNLKLYLYAYTSGTITSYVDYMRVKQDILLKVANIISKNGAKLAVPVTNVHVGDKPY